MKSCGPGMPSWKTTGSSSVDLSMANLIPILVWDEFLNLEAFDANISERSSGNCFKIPRCLQGKNPSLQRVWMSLIMPRRCGVFSSQGLKKCMGFGVHCTTHVIFLGTLTKVVVSLSDEYKAAEGEDRATFVVGLSMWRLDVPVWCV